LALPDYFASVPLHAALQFHPTASPIIRRMADLRPDTLLCRNVYGQTPVERALSQPAVGHGGGGSAAADLLRDLVELRPGSAIPTGRADDEAAAAAAAGPEDTTLMRACGRFPGRSDLLAALVRAYPPALCLATRRPWRISRHRADPPWAGGGPPRLPFEGAGEGRPPPPAFVAAETLHMALAVVECAFSVGGGSADDDDDDDDDDAVGGFRRHVKGAVATFLPDVDLEGSASGYAVARALRKLHRMDLCRALFHPQHVSHPLRTDDAFRDAVMGRTTLDLYRMNRLGRLDDDEDNAVSTEVAAAKHVQLLELVNDNVECIYLHVRDNWVHLLPPRPGFGRFAGIGTTARGEADGTAVPYLVR
jgi:hypothetical protein